MVSTRQLEPLGYPRSSVAKAAKAGRLHRVRRGVYVLALVTHRADRFHEVLIAAGPAPAMSPFVAGHESDAWWPDHRFGVELDVQETHGSRLSFEEDRERDDELLLAGIETTRVTGQRLAREPGAVVESVRRHLARRGAG